MANGVYQLGSQLAAGLLNNRFFYITIASVNFNLDQFVVAECAIQFCDNVIGQTFVGNGNHRLELVSDAAQVFFVVVAKCHRMGLFFGSEL